MSTPPGPSIPAAGDAVTVLDPDDPPAGGGRLVADSDGLLQLDRRSVPTAGEACIVTPGWVDLHTHVYDAVTQTGVRPDRVGLEQGVHLLGDAGSAGEGTVRGLLEYVLPRAQTEVRVWLNIGSHGLVHLREIAHPSFIDVDATLAAIAAHRGAICGVKVRSSGLILETMGLQPLQAARQVAREAGLPLMVHIGEEPPPIADVLDLLDVGDVITHCYHGKPGRPWNPDGTPVPALRRALDRGALLDVGHGAASFDAAVAQSAVAAGYPPDSISTDIHARNINGPVYDLATVMTKLLGCGLSLPDVVQRVTANPRRTLGVQQPWLDAGGRIVHATVFRVAPQAPPGRTYVDASGNTQHPDQHIIPMATIRNGTLHAIGPAAG